MVSESKIMSAPISNVRPPPDPLLVELRKADPAILSPEQALDLIRRLKDLAD